jgi:competence protein ComEA
MVVYTRQQILLIVLLVVAAGAGLAIDHWRRARPEVVERLENLDRRDRPRPAPGHAIAGEPHSAARRARPLAAHDGQHAARPAEPRAGGRRHPRESAGVDPVDINHATPAELTRLPGIGVTLAGRIVQARPFDALDDLARVRGLRRATLQRLRPLVAPLP